MSKNARVKVEELIIVPISLDLISFAKLREEKNREDALLSLLSRGVNNLEAVSFVSGCKQPEKTEVENA